MRANPKRKLIVECLNKGWNDKSISNHCLVSLATVRYYRRTYTDRANERQKYNPTIVKAMIEARKAGTLSWFCQAHKIPLTSTYRLMAEYEESQNLLSDLSTRGWVNPKITKECFAIGLGRNEAAKSCLYLKNLHLTIRIWKGVLYLYYKSNAHHLRFPLTFDDNVGLLVNPEKWLKQNQSRLKEGWQKVHAIQKRRKNASAHP